MFIILCSILWCRNIDGDLDDDGDDGVTTTLEAVVTTIHIMFIIVFVNNKINSDSVPKDSDNYTVLSRARTLFRTGYEI